MVHEGRDSAESTGIQTDVRPEDVEEALLYQIFRRGNQCLSQASINTGYGIAELQRAIRSLVGKGLIRERAHQENRPVEARSYEPNV